MKAEPTYLPEVMVLDPKVFPDERGYFMETWNARSFSAVTGLDVCFVQDNQSRSAKNVLRGVHYQLDKPQGKLVRAATGTVFNVAVDLRRSSPNFGKWVGVELSADNRRQLWVPCGFGHAFVVLSDFADCLYKTTDYWCPQHERRLAWNDAQIGIAWPIDAAPILSAKDAAAPNLAAAEVFP